MNFVHARPALGLLFAFNLSIASADEAEDRAQIENSIEAVRIGWLEADGTPFREHFLDFEGARYIESGGQNEGLDDLIEHHVEPEADAFDKLELNYSDPEIHLEGDFAWAIVDTEIKATVRRDGRNINNTGRGTYLFKKIGNEWKVVHTHNSSRPVKK